jgi:hypothetical protein
MLKTSTCRISRQIISANFNLLYYVLHSCFIFLRTRAVKDIFGIIPFLLVGGIAWLLFYGGADDASPLSPLG